MAFTYCHISKECSKCLKLSSIPPKGPTGEIQGRENIDGTAYYLTRWDID